MVISKSITNRLVGVLVILSVILILVPLLNPSNSSKSVKDEKNVDAIAITKQGAVTDNNGQLVSAGEHDYSDLLDPVDDTKPLVTTQSPFDNLNQNNQLPKADENYVYNQNLESATPISNEPAGPNQVLDTPQSAQEPSVQTEVLTSSRVNITQSQSNTNSNTARTVAKANAVKENASKIATGSYAAQVGAFTQKVKIDAVVNKLKQAGFNPVKHNISVNGKSLVRIYAGTAKDRNGALTICKRVKAKSLGLECQISQL